jgi:DNA-binding transcriptional MerR regulator
MASIQIGVQATFQIGEVAKRTALSIDAIRFYERRKLLPTPFRSAGGFRLYTTDDIERLRFVQLCSECSTWAFRLKKSSS